MTRHVSHVRFIRVLTGNFAFLLISTLLLFLLYPLFLSSAPGLLALNFFLSLLMISSLRAIGHEKKSFKLAIFFFALSLITSLLLTIWPSRALCVISTLVQVLFFVIVSLRLQHHLIESDRVTTEHLACALCIYLFIGIIWGQAYFALELIYPGSFAMASGEGSLVQSWVEGSHLHYAFFYYSFMTMATVGYGDIAPLAPFARSLAILEVVITQFYIAVLIGRLVGSFVRTREAGNITGHRQESAHKDESEGHGREKGDTHDPA